jgi:hypothetical protein
MATTAHPDGFKLTLLGIAGQGAAAAAPHDHTVTTSVTPAVLRDLFEQRLEHLVALGVLTPAQVKAFKTLLNDIESGKTPEPAPARGPTEATTPEGVLRNAIVSRATRAPQGVDPAGGSIFGFLADAFITLGGGIYGAITEGSVDGFLQGAAAAHQWAEDHIPDTLLS